MHFIGFWLWGFAVTASYYNDAAYLVSQCTLAIVIPQWPFLFTAINFLHIFKKNSNSSPPQLSIIYEFLHNLQVMNHMHLNL